MNRAVVVMNAVQCGWTESAQWWVLDLLFEEWVSDELDFIMGVGRYAKI